MGTLLGRRVLKVRTAPLTELIVPTQGCPFEMSGDKSALCNSTVLPLYIGYWLPVLSTVIVLEATLKAVEELMLS